MSEVAEKAAEATAEVVEESIDGVVETLEVIRTNPKMVALALFGGIGLGAGVGYFVAKKKLESFYEDRASQEIAEAKAFYANLNKVDENGAVLTPQQVLSQRHGEEAVDALRTYQGEGEAIEGAKDEQGGPWDDEMDAAQLAKIEAQLIEQRAEPDRVVVKEEVVEETVNVFNDPHFDLAEEKKSRTKTRPYVITHDEYFNAEKDYDQISYTYYESDDTLVDEKDNPVTEIDKLISDEALARFGHGSKDKNVVYVRNDKMASDFEIVRSNGSYLVEVLGLPPEDEPNSLRHSNRNAELNRRRDFRRGMD